MSSFCSSGRWIAGSRNQVTIGFPQDDQRKNCWFKYTFYLISLLYRCVIFDLLIYFSPVDWPKPLTLRPITIDFLYHRCASAYYCHSHDVWMNSFYFIIILFCMRLQVLYNLFLIHMIYLFFSYYAKHREREREKIIIPEKKTLHRGIK